MLQEKIDQLREQLTGILDKARAEIASNARDEISISLRRSSRPKMLKAAAPKSHAVSKVNRSGRTSKTNLRAKSVAPTKRKRLSPLAGQKRAASPTGPLAPAVVKVLKANGKAMNVRDILDRLFSNGYKFNSSEPKKNLAARIYRLKGVKQVSAGLFGLSR